MLLYFQNQTQFVVHHMFPLFVAEGQLKCLHLSVCVGQWTSGMLAT